MTVVMILSKKVSNDIKGKYAGPVPGDMLGVRSSGAVVGGRTDFLDNPI